MFRIDWLFITRMYCTVYAAYGIYRAGNMLQFCKVTYINIVTESIKYCFVRKVSDYVIFFGGEGGILKAFQKMQWILTL